MAIELDRSPKLDHAFKQYFINHNEQKEAERRKKEATAIIKKAVGDNTEARYSGVNIKLKKVERVSYKAHTLESLEEAGLIPPGMIDLARTTSNYTSTSISGSLND